MYGLYFKMDIFKKEVYFFSVSSPSDKKLIHTYTFDDIMYMADDYFTGNYENKLQGLYNLMMKQIDVEENQDVQDLEKRLETEFDGNIFAEICLNVLYGTYQKQKDNMIHLGIINSLIDTVSQKFTLQTKSKIESTFKEITNSMNKLSEYTDNDFRYTSEIIFKSDGYILELQKRDEVMLYSVNEFVEPFIQIFLANIHLANLKVCTCKNCGRKYFDNTDKGYCPKTICRQAEENEIRKRIRLKRKANPYASLLDSFNTYIRQQKHKLTQKNLGTDVIERFDDEKNICLQKVRAEIESYKNSEKPIDDELTAYIDKQKQYIKNLYDNLSSVNI